MAPRRHIAGVLLLTAALQAGRVCGAGGHDGRVPPPVFATNDVGIRMMECLRVIARNLAPDDRALAGRVAQSGPSTPGVKARGLEIMTSRWDKGPQYALACLAAGENVAAANSQIVRWCRSYPIDRDHPQDAGDVDPRKVLRAALLPETRARLTADARSAIEDAAYDFVFKRSVIDPTAPPWSNARAPVWCMSGSENHDANQKMGNLLALEFLCRFGARRTGETPLADGRPAREHRAAWVSYWKEHTRQRAREGIFAEVAQPGSYGRATISAYMDLYDLVEDPVLRRLGGDLLTLHFAQLAGEFEPRTGTRGTIAITRAKDAIDRQFGFHWTKNLTYAWGWHDRPDEKILEGEAQIFTTHYRPPAVVTAMARGPRLPPYLSTMRCPGLGGDKTNSVIEASFADGSARNSYLRRTAWVAPEYMLAGLTSDPARHYLAISTQSRIAGMTFAGGAHDRVTVFGNANVDPASVSYGAINTLPWRDVLIAGRDPSGSTPVIRVYVAGGLWSNRVASSSGWTFLRSGDGFCALRIVAGGCSTSDAPHRMGVHLTLADRDAPVILQAGRAADHPGGFEAFRSAVESRTCVTFEDGVLRYRSLAGDDLAFTVKAPRLPEVNGMPLELNPPETYASPYLEMKHGTDLARIRFAGYEDLMLDFRY